MNFDERPYVSIIIPIYNSSKYLDECIQSCINQTLENIEIVCVNDGSTDESVEILTKYQRQDPRIHIISKANRGYGHSINVGLENARGQYIGIIESDDYVKKDMYEKLYSVARTNQYDVVKSSHIRFTTEEDVKKITACPLFDNESYYNKVLNTKENLYIFRQAKINPPGIYRRRFMEENKIRLNETPGASYQDNGLLWMIYTLADTMYFIKDPLYYVRRDNPTSAVCKKDNPMAMNAEYKFIREFLEQNPEHLERYKYMYTVFKYSAYRFTLRRIQPSLRFEYLLTCGKEFQEAFEKGEVRKEEYFTERDWGIVNLWVNSPDVFYEKYYRNRP